MADEDLLSITEARRAIGKDASDASVDTLLAAIVTAVSVRLDEVCGPIVRRTIEEEAHDGGEVDVLLRYRPVSEVTAVVEYADTAETTLTAETNATKPVDAFVLKGNGRAGILLRRSGNADRRFPAGRGNVLVTYVAGRYDSTAEVGAKFKDAARIMLANRWQSEEFSIADVGEYDVPRGAFPRFAIPNYVVEMLGRDEILFAGAIG